MKYEVAMTFRHRIEVEADSVEEAFDLAENMLPSFVSELESYEAELEEIE